MLPLFFFLLFCYNTVSVYFRKWQPVNAPVFEEPCAVSDVAFAPSVGRLYHVLAVAARNVYVYKMTIKDNSKESDVDSVSPSNYVIELLDVLKTSVPTFVQVCLFLTELAVSSVVF